MYFHNLNQFMRISAFLDRMISNYESTITCVMVLILDAIVSMIKKEGIEKLSIKKL